MRDPSGLSLVEFMVVVAIGLVVLAAGSQLVARQLANHRIDNRVLRLNQEVRAAMDMITRDIRRSGHRCDHGQAFSGSSSYLSGFEISELGTLVTYRYELCRDRTRDVHSVVASGFRVRSGRIQRLQTSGEWLDLTDGVTTIFGVLTFCYVPSLPTDCLTVPPAAAEVVDGGGKVVVKSVRVTLTGALAGDPGTVRTLTETVVLRNDELIIH